MEPIQRYIQVPNTTTTTKSVDYTSLQWERKWLENRLKQHYKYNWTIAVFPSGSCYLYWKNLRFKVSTKVWRIRCARYTLHQRKIRRAQYVLHYQSASHLSLSDLTRKASPHKTIKRKVRHHDCVKSIHSYRVYHFLYLCYVFLFSPKNR